MILKVILLVLATISAILFLVNLAKGRKYSSYVENLDSAEFFLKGIYVVGFSLNEGKLFRLRGKLEQNLKKQARLVWDNIYYEYYAN